MPSFATIDNADVLKSGVGLSNLDQEIRRREFIGRTVVGAAAASLSFGAAAIGRVASPNENIRVGVIGGGNGHSHRRSAIPPSDGVVENYSSGVPANTSRTSCSQLND
jgi:hypothetical protein